MQNNFMWIEIEDEEKAHFPKWDKVGWPKNTGHIGLKHF